MNVTLQPLDPTVRSGVIFYLTIIYAYYTILTFEAVYAITIITESLNRFLVHLKGGFEYEKERFRIQIQ